MSRSSISELLNIQYRMNTMIMGFSNAYFYNNQLIAAPQVAHRTLAFFGDEPLVFIDTAEGGLAGYLDGLYKAGIAVATGLALIMIVAGGLEYASAGSVGGKDGGKSKIKNALIGLLLALTSFIILQQINPGLIRNDLAVDATKAVGGITGQTVDLVAGGGTINQIIPPGQPGSYVLANNENPSTGTVFSNYSSLKQLLKRSCDN